MERKACVPCVALTCEERRHGRTQDEDHLAICPECNFTFCSLCNDGWHPGSVCLDAAGKLRLLEQRAKGKAATGEMRRQETLLRQDLANETYVAQNAKRCPECNMGIEKSEGCNKMTCRNCGVRRPALSL